MHDQLPPDPDAEGLIVLPDDLEQPSQDPADALEAIDLAADETDREV